MGTVVGRDLELERIASFLDLDGAPRALLLEGEAGIGKTTLWNAAGADAEARGYRVLSCTAVGSEAQLAFTALRDLLAGAFDEAAGDVPAPQRRALAATLLLEEPGGRPLEPGTIAVAALTALRALAARRPTIVAIDDVQWLDPASAGALAYVLRRVGDEPLAAVLARRAGADLGPLTLDATDERLVTLSVSNLTVGALGRILHSRLQVTYPRPTLHRIHEVSGGNPFYALELGRALGRSPSPVRQGDVLPIPGSLHELVWSRIVPLPPETVEALTFASALTSPSISVLERAFGGDAANALAAAHDANVALVDGESMRFAHPMFAAAVYNAASPGRRREIHARLAATVGDLEGGARHLALAAEAPDEAVADLVEEGARAAFRRGSPAAAAELVRQAHRLTPSPQGAEARRRRLAEVDYEFAAGDTARALVLVDDLLRDAPAGPSRARLLNRKARVCLFGDDIGQSVSLLYDALAQADDDRVLRAEIEEGLAWALFLARRDLTAAAVHAGSAARSALNRDDRAAVSESLAAQGLIEFALGRPWEETMSQALAIEDSMLDLRVLRHPSFAYGYCLIGADDLDRARGVFEDLERRTAQMGDEGSGPAIFNHLALIEWLAGNWDAAGRYADEGYELALEAGQPPNQASTLGKIALLAACRGDMDEAREVAWQALRIAGGPDAGPASPQGAMARGGETALWALGFVELSLENAAGADHFLQPMVETLLQAGIEEPGEIRCLPDEIEALVMLERLAEAEALLVRLEEWARRLDRPSTSALAGRCRGLLLAAQGDADGALAALEGAARVDAGMPFDVGRTLLALGKEQRRARQRKSARETLRRALAVFERLGAALWAEKTRSELGRIGGRAPSPGGLTQTEQRVAALVAEGKTNREVATELVVSVHTVEAALTSIYRKLNLRSRTELARLLGDQPARNI